MVALVRCDDTQNTTAPGAFLLSIYLSFIYIDFLNIFWIYNEYMINENYNLWFIFSATNVESTIGTPALLIDPTILTKQNITDEQYEVNTN